MPSCEQKTLLSVGDLRGHLRDALNGRMPKPDVAWAILDVWDAANALAVSVQEDDDWEVVRASDLNRLRKALGVLDE